MGTCRFCGKDAGFLHHEHEDCRARHDEAVRKIPEFFLKELRSGIPPAHFRDLVNEVASTNHVSATELRGLAVLGLKEMVDSALDSEEFSAFDDDRINEVKEAFGVKSADEDYASTAKKLKKAEILRSLNEGRLPTGIVVAGSNPLNLERDEQVIWIFNGAVAYTTKTQRQFVGQSTGVSFRVAKGLTFRTSAFRGHPVETQALVKIGAGDLVVTSRNVYFLSPLKTMKIPARKIVAITPHSDGITIARDAANASPLIITLDDPWFAANAITKLNKL